MKFKFTGGTTIHRIPPAAQRAIDIIRRQPVGTLLNSRALAERLNSSPSSVRQFCWAIPDELTVIYRQTKLYGHPKTIQAFKAEYGV